MENDLFPNPIARTDLPVRRKRWPRVLLILGILFLLLLVFLPQILGTPVGRKFAVSYIARKTHSAVVLESVKTSWFGGTTIKQLWIKDPMNRKMGCRSLICKASLLDLLRNNWSLGDATVEGLHVDYVLDNGRGLDSLDFLGGLTTAPPASLTPAPPAPRELPRLSGRIRITNGTIVLWRGSVQAKIYDTTWESARFDNVSASLDIQSLDVPWTYDIQAEHTEEGKPAGTIHSSGMVDLGAGGHVDLQQMQLDLSCEGRQIPTPLLGAVIVPRALPEDIRHTLGDTLKSVAFKARSSNGKLVLDPCNVEGSVAQAKLKFAIDLTRMPAQLTFVGDRNTLNLGLSRPVRSVLGHLNPFLREARFDQGAAHLAFESFSLPMRVNQWPYLTARGSMSVQQAVLIRNDELTAGAVVPENLASQLALLTGDADPTVPFEAEGPFVVGDARVSIPPQSTRVGPLKISVEGTTDLETGQITMLATIAPSPALKTAMPTASQATLMIPITGTVRRPVLNVLSPQGQLGTDAVKEIGEQVNQQVARMRAKENQRSIQRSQERLQELLQSLPGPTTRPQP